MPDWLSAWSLQHITALTALAAVIFGPLTTIYVTRRQINATVHAKTQLDWLAQLRDIMAEFLALAVHISAEVEVNSSCGADPNYQGRTRQLTYLGHKLYFMLDMNSMQHRELAQLIYNVSDLAMLMAFKNQREQIRVCFVESQKKMLNLAPVILRAELKKARRA